MCNTDDISHPIVLVETYLTEENLKNDYYLAKYERECHGWIPLTRLHQFNKLSTYKSDTILNALRAKRSNIIELNLTEPISIRRRRYPILHSSSKIDPDLHRTVVINGLPRDAKQEDLLIFFNRFYPVDRIQMFSTSAPVNRSFIGKIHLIFEFDFHAREFVQRSQLRSIIYINEYVLQLCNGYTLVCKMLVDCDDQDFNQQVSHGK